jgi:hypothetical protein
MGDNTASPVYGFFSITGYGAPDLMIADIVLAGILDRRDFDFLRPAPKNRLTGNK